VVPLYLVQQPEAVMPRHGDVGDDHIDIAEVDQGLIGRACRDDEGAHMLKNLFEKIAAVVMIFNDQHADTDQLIELVQSRHRGPSGSFFVAAGDPADVLKRCGGVNMKNFPYQRRRHHLAARGQRLGRPGRIARIPRLHLTRDIRVVELAIGGFVLTQ
jgi:hypothetical protein